MIDLFDILKTRIPSLNQIHPFLNSPFLPVDIEEFLEMIHISTQSFFPFFQSNQIK